MKKQQPQISEDKILETSWELLGEEGIEKFSMRRLADRLGIQAPSLYWYFKSKQTSTSVWPTRYRKLFWRSSTPKGTGRSRWTGLAVTVRSVLSRYPCSTQLMMMTLPHEPDMIRFTNRMLLCMESTPLRARAEITGRSYACELCILFRSGRLSASAQYLCCS